jgi:hypothetical protein
MPLIAEWEKYNLPATSYSRGSNEPLPITVKDLPSTYQSTVLALNY